MHLLFSQCLSSDFTSPGLYHHHLVVVGLFIALRWLAVFFVLNLCQLHTNVLHQQFVHSQIVLRFSMFCYNCCNIIVDQNVCRLMFSM